MASKSERASAALGSRGSNSDMSEDDIIAVARGGAKSSAYTGRGGGGSLINYSDSNYVQPTWTGNRTWSQAPVGPRINPTPSAEDYTSRMMSGESSVYSPRPQVRAFSPNAVLPRETLFPSSSTDDYLTARMSWVAPGRGAPSSYSAEEDSNPYLTSMMYGPSGAYPEWQKTAVPEASRFGSWNEFLAPGNYSNNSYVRGMMDVPSAVPVNREFAQADISRPTLKDMRDVATGVRLPSLPNPTLGPSLRNVTPSPDVRYDLSMPALDAAKAAQGPSIQKLPAQGPKTSSASGVVEVGGKFVTSSSAEKKRAADQAAWNAANPSMAVDLNGNPIAPTAPVTATSPRPLPAGPQPAQPKLLSYDKTGPVYTEYTNRYGAQQQRAPWLKTPSWEEYVTGLNNVTNRQYQRSVYAANPNAPVNQFNVPGSKRSNESWYLPSGEWPPGMTYEEALYNYIWKTRRARLAQIEAARRG